MLIFFIKGVLISVSLAITAPLVSGGQCPDQRHKHLIEPCVCGDNQILCLSDRSFDLKTVFDYLTLTIHWKERKFERLVIDAPEVTQLDETSFSEIWFEEIVITNAKNLQRIHSNAFGGTRMFAKRVAIVDAKHLNTSNEYNVFDALSSFNNLQSLSVSGVGLQEVPDFAFRPLLGTQWDLKNITIKGDLKRIGNYAFYDPAYWMTRITLGNQISYISGHAFDMRTSAHNELTIDLSHNQLTTDSFESGVFLNTKRQLFVNLTSNLLSHLDEFIFEPFLDQNLMNRLDIGDNPLVCDCRMKWLVKNRNQYERQVMNALCSDGRSFWSYTTEELNDCKTSDVLI